MGCIGTSLTTFANIFSFPSSIIVKKNESPLWTTKYIFAEHYSKHTPVSDRLYKEMRNELWKGRIQTVAKVIWAASIVLPVLDAVAWMFRFLAKCDPVISARYSLIASNKQANDEAKRVQVLADSVREFAGFCMDVGCKKEIDSGMQYETMLPLREERFSHFCSHFRKGRLQDAVLKSTRQMLKLMQECAREHKELREALERIETHAKESDNCDWMKGERENPLYPAWECLVGQYNEFYRTLIT